MPPLTCSASPFTRPSLLLRRVTHAMVIDRTHLLTLRAGRSPLHVIQADYEQAKRELTGESDAVRQDALITP